MKFRNLRTPLMTTRRRPGRLADRQSARLSSRHRARLAGRQRHDQYSAKFYTVACCRVPLLLLLTVSASFSLSVPLSPFLALSLRLSVPVSVCLRTARPVAQSLLYQPLAAVQFYVSYYAILFRCSLRDPVGQSPPRQPASLRTLDTALTFHGPVRFHPQSVQLQTMSAEFPTYFVATHYATVCGT